MGTYERRLIEQRLKTAARNVKRALEDLREEHPMDETTVGYVARAEDQLICAIDWYQRQTDSKSDPRGRRPRYDQRGA